MFDGLELSSKGEVVERKLERGSLLNQSDMKDILVRDLRIIDSTYRHQLPSVLPKEDVYIINLEYVKAMCSCDRLLLFDAKRPAVQNLARNIALAAGAIAAAVRAACTENILDDVCKSVRSTLSPPAACRPP